MLCVDTNVLLYAFRLDLPEHAEYAPLLERLANGDETLGIPDLVLSGSSGSSPTGGRSWSPPRCRRLGRSSTT